MSCRLIRPAKTPNHVRTSICQMFVRTCIGFRDCFTATCEITEVPDIDEPAPFLSCAQRVNTVSHPNARSNLIYLGNIKHLLAQQIRLFFKALVDVNLPVLRMERFELSS